jgi:proton glutamate symport protein
MHGRSPSVAVARRDRSRNSGKSADMGAGRGLLGVLVGLFFGERAAVPQPVGVAYSMMLESVIYPYILSSLIGGLGGLVRARAVRLLRASWAVYLFLWLVALGAIFLLTQD